MSKKSNSIPKAHAHASADAMDWDEAIALIHRVHDDGKIRQAMLLACGCHLGLRISDLLTLTWGQLLEAEPIVLTEKKTGKKRMLKVNSALSSFAHECMLELNITNPSELVFIGRQSKNKTAITRQRADQILRSIAKEYNVKSARNFSAHTLRKTFGRRVYNQFCNEGRGDFALQLLGDVFGHSSTRITKRYLGISRDEILSAYDNL